MLIKTEIDTYFNPDNIAYARVLDYILKDAREKEIKVIFCEITNLDIRRFCQNKGFKGNYSPHCYIVI